MICPFCGSEIADNSSFCTSCGKKIEQSSVDTTVLNAQNSQNTANDAPPSPVLQQNQYTAGGYQQQPYMNYAPQITHASQLPSEFRPISAWGYFGYNLLFGIPLVGFICLIIFAVSAANVNLKNYARSFFIVYIIAIVAIIVFFVILFAAGASLDLADYFNRIRI